jgi:peptidoglycan/xylan/chitin deacetylase (PgdA/CDA1 family)
MSTVCLTFDFDAFSVWIAGDETSATQLSRGEFAKVGAERVLALLQRRRIASTWFIPGHTIETYPALCARVRDEGHEIGHHGYMHEAASTLTRVAQAAVLDRGTECIFKLTGHPPAGYRAPFFDLSSDTCDLLLERGFRYDSSMMGHDHYPYRCRRGDIVTRDSALVFGHETDLWEMPVSWSLDDFPHFEYMRGKFLQPGHAAASNVLENWADDFKYMNRECDDGILLYTMHPDVIGRGHRMLFLERLLDKVAEMGAHFARLDEALDRHRGTASHTAPDSGQALG